MRGQRPSLSRERSSLLRVIAQKSWPILGADTRVVELGAQALLPGFIDAHGHFSALSRYGDMLNLFPPVGDVVSIEDLIRKIRLHIEQQDIPRQLITALAMMIRCLLRTDIPTAMTLILPAPGIR